MQRTTAAAAVLLATALSACIATAAAAQDDFSELNLKVGQAVRVTEDGLTLTGEVVALSPTQLHVGDHHLSPGPGLKIERDRGHTGLKGMAIGAGISAAIGLANSHGNGWGLVGMFPGAFWGGLIGVGMDQYVPVYDTTSFGLTSPQLTLPAPPAPAPMALPPFAGLRARVGDRVFVTQRGVTVAGTIQALSATTLVVGVHEFSDGGQLRIEKDGDPIWDGAATGFFVGVVLGACGGCNDGQHVNVMAAGLEMAAIGALIDWAHHGTTTIYDTTTKASRSRTIHVAPAIGPHQKGIVVRMLR